MKLTQMKKAGLVLAVILTSTSTYAYDKHDAKHACLNKVTQHGHGQYHHAKDVHVEDKGHHSYKIKGKVKSRRDKHTYNFTCKIRHKELVDWRVTSHSNRSSNSNHSNHSNHSNKNTAIAAGAGIIALIAIAAANDNKHNGHDKGASALDDMSYLKKQCRQNLRHHINREDQPIRKIHLDTAHLHNRTLVGEGGVLFERGGGSDIAYRCEFDRQGRIHDGHYRFH